MKSTLNRLLGPVYHGRDLYSHSVLHDASFDIIISGLLRKDAEELISDVYKNSTPVNILSRVESALSSVESSCSVSYTAALQYVGRNMSGPHIRFAGVGGKQRYFLNGDNEVVVGESVKPVVSDVSVHLYDKLFLCSPGVANNFTDSEITNMLKMSSNPNNGIRNLRSTLKGKKSKKENYFYGDQTAALRYFDRVL